MSGTTHIRSIEDLSGPAGRLEAVLNSGSADARYAALVCHPHPLGGGTMHNKVVYHAMKALSSLGLPVMRFNFRGVGLSEGEHDHARGEVDDVRAAIEWMDGNLKLPILLAGFSFGSFVGLLAGCEDERVKGLVGLGIPYLAEGRSYSFSFLEECPKPKLFVSGTEDQFGAREKVEPTLRAAAAPKRIVWVEGAEHFFQGTSASPGAKLDQMQGAIKRWLHDQFGLG
jgi:alpha/beta superfamily hydrolase